ncbi:hypothetical protein [Chryseolinea sp. H1M3-3]|uniref:hypothetical protein n=1 Tax=Chryseolinea sp. H1M3-3 TaxID=3034144 RepID=UPI0023EB3226|nr:hypothetical protein [Chryseolinea sp. H1M3-3]
MNKKWGLLIIVLFTGVALIASTPEQRQAVAQYIFICIITGIVLRFIGLAIGKLIRKLIKED